MDKEAERRAMRQRRLEWAQRPLAGGLATHGRPAGAAPTSGSQHAASLGSCDWPVDIPMIERHRIVRGWTRLQLATAAHVDPKTLRDLLGRRRRPNLGTVQAVSVALGLTLSDVIWFA